jgi:CDP-diacylglycerol--glycerol-3-phosphate 3-phosphatidyltransferase
VTDQRLTWQSYLDHWSGLHGGYDPRRASPPVLGWLRLAYLSARFLAPLPVGPNAVTAAGLLLSAGVPVLASRGPVWSLTAAGLVLLSALADTADGALAVVTGRTTRLGELYDSVADRLAEGCWLLAFWLAGAPAWLVVAGGGVAWLHEYLRARATVAGMRDVGVVTVAERPTRVLVAVLGLAVAGLGGAIGPELAVGTVTVAAALWGVLGTVGLGQLLVAAHQALAKEGLR